MAEENIGGITIGVVYGGRLVWIRSYGYADIAGKIPITKDSVFGIGSIAKQFTALMLLQSSIKKTVELNGAERETAKMG